MNKKSIIRNIIDIPMKFCTLKNISEYKLLEQSGYFELYNEISIEDIFSELDSDSVNYWVQFSEDNRGFPAWYILNENGKYIVGYSDGENSFELEPFLNLNLACATFIKNSIEQTRKLFLKK